MTANALRPTEDPPEDQEVKPSPVSRARRRRVLTALLRVATHATFLVMALGLAGHAARDRNLALALLMYIPLVPLGLWAVVLDLVRRGRSLRPRFALTLMGFVCVLWGGYPMIGLRSPEGAPPGSHEITLLHWNMQSGGKRANKPRWERAAEQILARQPDVIVLSEAPPDRWIFDALYRVNRGWRTVHISNQPEARYWYKPLVCSRWPMTFEGEVAVRNGAAMSVLVEVRKKPLRLLVVDGVSSPTVVRTAFLHDVAAACEAAAAGGRPYDVVVGDFNAVGRSVGFDRVRTSAGGYRPSADYGGGWRGTWPVPVPVYDIDHVWVRAGRAVTRCRLYSGEVFDTDHRGQFVGLALPAQ